MKVCIDTSALALSGAGVRRVLAETAQAMSFDATEDGIDVSFFPFSPRGYAAGGHRTGMKPIRALLKPGIERGLNTWTRMHYPGVDKLLGDADLYQISEYLPYPVRRVRQLAVLHDLVAVRHPEWCAPSSVSWQRRRIEYIAEHCVHVVCPSEPVRQSWLAFSGWREQRTTVVPWGVDGSFKQRGVGEIEHVRDRLRIRRPYVLHVGTIEPRKNLAFVLHAFERATKHFPQEMDLVFAGAKGWRTGQLEQALEFTNIRDRVRLLGAVAEEYLPALMSGASCLVLASREEGFGLPALEALACGTPVVTTQAMALPEELRPFCVRVGGVDEEELADALVEIVDDDDARQQAQSEAAPLARARTWQHVAADLRKVYLQFS